MKDGNLFADALAPPLGERFEELLRRGPLRIERIVSAEGGPGPPYCQAHDEWVVLLRGQARLEVDGTGRDLVAGDHVFLAAGTPHRVLATSQGALWLAVHLEPGAG